jgi:hypothetical protein
VAPPGRTRGRGGRVAACPQSNPPWRSGSIGLSVFQNLSKTAAEPEGLGIGAAARRTAAADSPPRCRRRQSSQGPLGFTSEASKRCSNPRLVRRAPASRRRVGTRRAPAAAAVALDFCAVTGSMHDASHSRGLGLASNSAPDVQYYRSDRVVRFARNPGHRELLAVDGPSDAWRASRKGSADSGIGICGVVCTTR